VSNQTSRIVDKIAQNREWLAGKSDLYALVPEALI
jgi:hypothetical protein